MPIASARELPISHKPIENRLSTNGLHPSHLQKTTTCLSSCAGHSRLPIEVFALLDSKSPTTAQQRVNNASKCATNNAKQLRKAPVS